MPTTNNLFDLTGKVAIITGGNGNLGTQYAKTLAAAGANIVLVDLNPELCQMKASQLTKEFNRKIKGIPTDISKKEAVQNMIQQVEQEFGKVDILINNAAFNRPANDNESSFIDFPDYPLDLWDKCLQVNLTGMFLCTQEVVKLMIKNNTPGSIINISSTYGLVSPDQKIYSHIKHPKDASKKFVKSIDYPTTKSAVLNFTRYLAAHYGEKGIRVNTLTPGGVWDNQEKNFVKGYSNRTPLGRMAKNTEYNGAILFLSSEASSYMTGANLVIDGGWTCW